MVNLLGKTSFSIVFAPYKATLAHVRSRRSRVPAPTKQGRSLVSPGAQMPEEGVSLKSFKHAFMLLDSFTIAAFVLIPARKEGNALPQGTPPWFYLWLLRMESKWCRYGR